MKKIPLLIFLALLASPASFAVAFIDYSAPGTKVRFTQEVVNGYTVTQAQATVTTVDSDTGEITVRRQTQVIVPDGGGGFDKIVTSEETVATPTGVEGVYDVTVRTEEVTTELDEEQQPTGTPPATTNTEVVDEDVVDPDLPEATTFTPIEDELDQPVVISPL